VEKFSKDSCVVSFKARGKSFMKCIGMLTLMSCKKNHKENISMKIKAFMEMFWKILPA
jgi:hypothetical protein